MIKVIIFILNLILFRKPEEEEDKKPPVSGDPVGDGISWSPIAKGGTSFRTHKAVIRDSSRFEFQLTTMMIIFPLAWILGAAFMLRMTFIDILYEIQIVTIFIRVVLVIFIFVGFYLLFMGWNRRVFDKNIGYYWKGRLKPIALTDPENYSLVRLDDIYAIQILSEYIRRSGGDAGSGFTSYELNLVLKSGKRINILDHSSLMGIRTDARMLSEFLKVPIFDRA